MPLIKDLPPLEGDLTGAETIIVEDAEGTKRANVDVLATRADLAAKADASAMNEADGALGERIDGEVQNRDIAIEAAKSDLAPEKELLERERFPVFATRDYVVSWIENGHLEFMAIGAQTRTMLGLDAIRSRQLLEGERFPVSATRDFVISWVENGKLEFMPVGTKTRVMLGVDAIKSSQLLDTSHIPVVNPIAGQIPIWIKNGLMEFMGLGPDTIAAIAAQIGASTDVPIAPSDAERGRYMRRTRAKCAMLRAGVGQLHILVGFDSWTENPSLPQIEANRLYARYGKGGEGWQSARGANSYTLNGLENFLTGANWTVLDLTTEPNPVPTRRYGIDGFVAFTSTPDHRWTIAKAQFDKAWLFYDQASVGSFVYSIDGGATWSDPVASLGVNALGVVAVDSPSDAVRSIIGKHVSGETARLGEFLKSNRPGVIYSKAGNSGATALHMASIAGNMGDIAAVIQPDLLKIRLGTNDATNSYDSTVATFVSKTEEIVEGIRTGAPLCEVLLSYPPANGGNVQRPQTEFAAGWWGLSRRKGYEFVNHTASLGSYTETGPDGLNLWATTNGQPDKTHMAMIGHEVVVDIESSYYLGDA